MHRRIFVKQPVMPESTAAQFTFGAFAHSFPHCRYAYRAEQPRNRIKSVKKA